MYSLGSTSRLSEKQVHRDRLSGPLRLRLLLYNPATLLTINHLFRPGDLTAASYCFYMNTLWYWCSSKVRVDRNMAAWWQGDKVGVRKKTTSGLDLCRLWPLCVNMGHSVLTPWLPCSTGGPTKASDRAGKRRLMTTDPPSFIPSLSSFFLHPSYCHCLSVSFQTKRLFRRLQNKTHHPPFTLGLSKAQQTLSWTQKKKRTCSVLFFFVFCFFFSLSVVFQGRELLTPDQRGYHSKHGTHPTPSTQTL